MGFFNNGVEASSGSYGVWANVPCPLRYTPLGGICGWIWWLVETQGLVPLALASALWY